MGRRCLKVIRVMGTRRWDARCARPLSPRLDEITCLSSTPEGEREPLVLCGASLMGCYPPYRLYVRDADFD